MTSQYRCYHVDDKIIKQCKYCPNSRGGLWYVSFCIGIENHHPIKREELEIIPDWCPLPVHSDFQSGRDIEQLKKAIIEVLDTGFESSERDMVLVLDQIGAWEKGELRKGGEP
jgi:hypothetical protein